ncbi:putative frv operon regulatory protein [Lactiplantibacillus sp. WILCCON 0030]|uniref:Frv operon regulatory protein n=1 Tax=Lactiplantibacillus brownii TaxID=3069269 RepID=A0ABU1ACF5_9LACO|nr:putative frv operon regulatory protein [Lactiplantibacillus brownii]MDQ7938657.1 putative frv operon regulatory protein [Lactiplantibacillus brownii]
MLNSRELRIILLLQEHDLSGEELATLLATSRRTVVRDVARINAILADEKVGSVESIKKYHLLILNTANFNQLLMRVNNESNLVLFYLLTQPNISMAELGEKTFLSRQNILNSIEKINRQFKNVLTINLRPRIGIAIEIAHISRIDVLAALILDNRQLVANQLKQKQISPDINTPAKIIRQAMPERLFDYLTENQLQAQILACCLIATQTIRVSNQKLLDTLIQHDVRLEVASVLTNFFETKISLLNSLTIRQVHNAIEATKTRYTLDTLNNHFAEEIFNHLCRSSMFPTFVPDSLSEQIRYLKIQNPFAFDFAFDLTKMLQAAFEKVQIDDEYIALYVLRAIETPIARDVRTLMYATRQSVANINKMIISEQVPNLDIEMVFSKEQLETQLSYIDFDLIIGNGLYANDLKIPVHFDSTFNGVISQNELNRLKNLSSESYIQENLTNFFPKSHFVRLSGRYHHAKHVLRDGAAKFNEAGLLTTDQVKALIAREDAGNQLILNHISIPHASAVLVDSYELFAISFDGEIKIGGKPIYLMILVLANQDRQDSGQVFGYIYNKIKNLSITQLEKLLDYQQVIDLLSDM